MKRLNNTGYDSYLVGGGVRDLLLGSAPKDFDIATNATPEDIKKLFNNAKIIGRRFKIVHIRFGQEIIEVTTFRGSNNDSSQQIESSTGQLLRDNVYGTLESDAIRRDFTINALYYSINDFSIHDFSSGIQDIQQRCLRIIGDPITRYQEDPVRLLRAIRFSAKLGFTIEENTAQPIISQAPLLQHVPPARLFDEALKLFMNGYATASYQQLQNYCLFEQLFPQTASVAQQNTDQQSFLEVAMTSTDKRIRAEKRVTPAFLYAALLWPALEFTYHDLEEKAARENNKIPEMNLFHEAAHLTIEAQLQRIMIPRRFMTPMKQIWELQWRLPKRMGSKAYRLLEHPRFRAGYDFLLLREAAGKDLQSLGYWWTQFQEANETEQQDLIKALNPQENKRRKRKKQRTENSE